MTLSKRSPAPLKKALEKSDPYTSKPKPIFGSSNPPRAVLGNLQRRRCKMSEVSSELRWVLVEGPGPGEAGFLGRWLLAADEADQKLRQQFKENPRLRQQVERLEVLYLISFSSPATRFIQLLMENSVCFSLELGEEWGESFAVMADLGFFRLNSNRYQMTIPNEITGSRIEAALLRLAATEDHQSFLYPEHLLASLSKADAHSLKRLFVKASIPRISGYIDNYYSVGRR
jgi:hypothetical protein